MKRQKSGRPAKANYIDVKHGEQTHRVVLKRVATARRFTLRVRAAGGAVVLTMPPNGSLTAARAFVTRYAGWVTDRLGQMHRPIRFEPGATIPFRGVPHRLEERAALRCRVWVDGSDAGPLLCVSRRGRPFAAAVDDFLKAEARKALTEAVARHAARVSRTVSRITLRDTKSRWGSCTARKALNFSWRLILAPPSVLDYLAAHEVAHLVHMDHSEAFWALARTLAPEGAQAERWLKQHGASLHLYGEPPEVRPRPES